MEYKLRQKNYDFWLERLKTNQEEALVCSKDIALSEVEDKELLKSVFEKTKKDRKDFGVKKKQVEF